MKPIILTDASDDSLETIQEHVINVLKDNKVTVLTTSYDSLIVRPSEIQAVLITKKPEEEKSNGKYSETLKIDDSTDNN